MFKLGVLVSGNGSNLQSIIDSCESGYIPDTEVVVVISNRRDAYALERAKKNDILSLFVNPKEYRTTEEYSDKLIEILVQNKVDLVCLAGYLMKLGNNFISRFKGKIINIHPALLPKFGGKGMYGHYVHEAVIKSGEKESGATVHFVDEVYDHGGIILQKKVVVLPGDTPEKLAARVLGQEHKLFPEAIKLVLASLKKN